MILFWRKKPWVDLQHEEEFIPKNYSERGVDTGAKLEEQLVGNVDLERIHSRTKSMSLAEILAWLDKHGEEFDETTFIVNTDDGNALDTLKGHHPRLIINKMGLTRIRHLNTFLNKANENLVDGAVKLMIGWTLKENADKVVDYLEKQHIFYELEDPAFDDNVPIQIKNDKFSSLFEPILRMYSLPNYHDIDPLPLFAPYCL